MLHFLKIFLLILLFTACEKKMEWELNNINNNSIIVEGIITNENKQHEIKLTKPVSNLNERPENVSGATVLVYDGSNTYFFVEDDNSPGVYKSENSFIGVINKFYSLKIRYNDKTYKAGNYMIPVNLFTPLIYSFNPDTSLYYISNVANVFSSEESAMWEILIDWSHLPEYSGTPEELTKAKLYYYTLKTIDINQVFAPEKETVYFPEGAIITQRKYSLNQQHAEFIRSLLSETEWRGGFFDTAQGNVKTNLSNGALGYFGLCSVVSQTFVVE